jgi:alcohol dehydrogenase (NADP+)
MVSVAAARIAEIHAGMTALMSFQLLTRTAYFLIDGIKEIQEMLDFCAEHKIVFGREIIPIPIIYEAYERMLKSDVKNRFVIDMSSLEIA